MSNEKSVVRTAWKRIEAWLQANGDSGKLALPPGASPQVIDRVESALDNRFPADLRESYALHDGRYGLWIFEEGYLLPLTGEAAPLGFQGNCVIRIWTGMLDVGKALENERSQPQGPIKNDWWNKNWIPVIDNECGDDVCIDMDPPDDGQVGQVIDWWHEQGATRVLAKSFGEFLAKHAEALEAGKYRISDSGDRIEPAR